MFVQLNRQQRTKVERKYVEIAQERNYNSVLSDNYNPSINPDRLGET
ncbi:hypothetical protein [Moorena sp. SIO2C4]|nr:hypothetical protein [Moorena sp. SIO2C4]NES42143.1 hypothetical protein [Moorena sp. SIO2C4]